MYIKSLAIFLQFLKVRVLQTVLVSVMSEIVTHQVQDDNPEKNDGDL
jgi:hypothetical protein